MLAIRKILICFIFGFAFATYPTFANTWTIFLYADSSDSLSDVMLKNLSDLLAAQAQDNVTIAVQLHAVGTTAYRYIIKNNTLLPATTIELTHSSPIQSLVNGAQWAFDTYQSDNTMLIFWNHGFGALDPQWNTISQKWEPEPDIYSTANQLDPEEIFDTTNAACSLRTIRTQRIKHRGYMFSATPREYLTNNDLIAAIQSVCKNLGNRKIDIIGFDTCMGSMLENAYHLMPFANYLIGVQSCASRDGWNYKAFGEAFDTPMKTPAAIAQSLVKGFEDYYITSEANDLYTLTALDLSQIQAIKNLVDNSAQLLAQCVTIYGKKAIRKALRSAHSDCLTLCLFPMYTDMYTLSKSLNQKLAILETSEQLIMLRGTLDMLCNTIKKAVIAHCYGYALKDKAHGISIYFPHYHTDSSYASTLFGRESQWGKVVELATGEITV